MKARSAAFEVGGMMRREAARHLSFDFMGGRMTKVD